MCNPVAMAAMAVVQGVMQIQQGRAQAKATMMEGANAKKIADFNASQKELQADDAVRRGAIEASEKREIARRLTSTGATRMAGGGLISNTGTNLDLLSQNIGQGEDNALMVLNNAEREGYGYRAEAQSSRFSGQVAANNAAYSAGVQKQSGLMTGIGTIITGFGDYGKSQGWFSKSAGSTRSYQTPFGMRRFSTV